MHVMWRLWSYRLAFRGPCSGKSRHGVDYGQRAHSHSFRSGKRWHLQLIRSVLLLHRRSQRASFILRYHSLTLRVHGGIITMLHTLVSSVIWRGTDCDGYDDNGDDRHITRVPRSCRFWNVGPPWAAIPVKVALNSHFRISLLSVRSSWRQATVS